MKVIKSLPDDCTIEDIQYRLYVLEKVEQGIRAIDEGRVVPHEEVEKRVRKWLKSFGQNQR
ncbi:MAG TPA: hypothetical protein VJ440_03675 [Candidatus Brocadiaceae bacterium]|nr:hypothetical protein [Candidatus Brocadiaceae bacterium]